MSARAESPTESFQRVKQDAAVYAAGLGMFLEAFIGECSEAEDRSCAEHAKAFRQKVEGKKFLFEAPDESAAMLEAEPENRSGGALILDLTPFFPAKGYALTNGAPKKTDAHGNPMVSRLQIPVQLPEDRSWNDVLRMVSTHSVRVEFIATPRSVWVVRRPKGKKGFGVAADVDAVLITSNRSGEALAFWKRR